MNYLAGVTGLRVRVFIVGTVTGIIPTTAAYVAVGAYGARPGSWPFLAAIRRVVASQGSGVMRLLCQVTPSTPRGGPMRTPVAVARPACVIVGTVMVLMVIRPLPALVSGAWRRALGSARRAGL